LLSGEKLPHGFIFATFMTASMVGTALAGRLMSHTRLEVLMQVMSDPGTDGGMRDRDGSELSVGNFQQIVKPLIKPLISHLTSRFETVTVCHAACCSIHVMSCHVMICHAACCSIHVMSCHVMICHAACCSIHVMSCHVMICHAACCSIQVSVVAPLAGWYQGHLSIAQEEKLL
jgi:hypothetical protein